MLQEFVKLRKMVPKEALSLIAELERTFNMRDRLISIAQEVIDTLTLDVKYLIFDLEATKRESLPES